MKVVLGITIQSTIDVADSTEAEQAALFRSIHLPNQGLAMQQHDPRYLHVYDEDR